MVGHVGNRPEYRIGAGARGCGYTATMEASQPPFWVQIMSQQGCAVPTIGVALMHVSERQAPVPVDSEHRSRRRPAPPWAHRRSRRSYFHTGDRTRDWNLPRSANGQARRQDRSIQPDPWEIQPRPGSAIRNGAGIAGTSRYVGSMQAPSRKSGYHHTGNRLDKAWFSSFMTAALVADKASTPKRSVLPLPGHCRPCKVSTVSTQHRLQQSLSISGRRCACRQPCRASNGSIAGNRRCDLTGIRRKPLCTAHASCVCNKDAAKRRLQKRPTIPPSQRYKSRGPSAYPILNLTSRPCRLAVWPFGCQDQVLRYRQALLAGSVTAH